MLDPKLQNDLQKEAFRRDVAARFGQLADTAAHLRQAGQDERRCEKLLDQLMALRSELDAAVLFILDFHFDRCVRDAILAGREEEVIRGIKRTVGLVAQAQVVSPAMAKSEVEERPELERRTG